MTITQNDRAQWRTQAQGILDAPHAHQDPSSSAVEGQAERIIILLDALDESEASYRTLLAENDQIRLRNKNLSMGRQENSMSEEERFYVQAITSEYRVMGRVQRWLFRYVAPFTEIAARHLADTETEEA